MKNAELRELLRRSMTIAETAMRTIDAFSLTRRTLDKVTGTNLSADLDKSEVGIKADIREHQARLIAAIDELDGK